MICLDFNLFSRGPGAKGPLKAVTASVKGDDTWPVWIVVGSDGRSNILSGPEGCVLTTRCVAEKLADIWNKEVMVA